MTVMKSTLHIFFVEFKFLTKMDLISSLFVALFLFQFLPSINRYTDNAVMLASSADDEPLITMELDGMTVKPYGNPANYLKSTADIPVYWYNMRYWNIVYYGGLYLDMAMVIWVPLKTFGCPLFPTAPLILRLLTLFFSVLTLLAVYNLSRAYFGPMSAVFGMLALLTTIHFLEIGTMIHPDSLLFFLLLLGLALCIRHAKDGTLSSALAIGLVAGLGQSAKMAGSAPLIPVTIMAIVAGLHRIKVPFSSRWIWLVVSRGTFMFLTAVVTFLITTPYALLDSYFFRTWKRGAGVLASKSPMSETTFWDWVFAFYKEMGAVFLLLSLAGFIVYLSQARRGKKNLAYLFFIILSLSVFIWYAALQKYWVQLQYLVVVIAFVGVSAGYFVDQKIKGTAKIMTLIVCLFLLEDKIFLNNIMVPLRYTEWRNSTPLRTNDWAVKNISREEDAILFHYGVYFDPQKFPHQIPNGGPIRYVDIDSKKPNYFIIVQPWGGWMLENLKQSPSDQWSENYNSLRLYQDLLELNELGDLTVKLNGVRGVSHVATITRNEDCYSQNISKPALPKWLCLVRSWSNGVSPLFPAGSQRLFVFKVNQKEFPRKP